MGVKGLATFLRDNRQSICRTVQLEPRDDAGANGGAGRIPVVVDAWGLIYQLWQSTLPWQSGGEYLVFYRLVLRLIASWRSVSLEPIFIFDGPAPSSKHPTLLSRADDQVRTAQLFYTTSAPSRSLPSFSRGRIILPHLASHTFVHALHAAGAEARFVPEGEADGVCVRVAEEVGGYVFGLDSDYMVLVSASTVGSLRGYCPFDMMSWLEPAPTAGTDSGVGFGGEDDDTSNGWSVAAKPRPNRNRNSAHSSFLPTVPRSSLVLTVIAPSALRTRLRLPAQMMPLFASLVGNDHTPPRAAEHFFEPGLSLPQRVEKAARILREVVYAPQAASTSARRANGAALGGSGSAVAGAGAGAGADVGDHAVRLVRRVIAKLAWKPFDASGVLDEVVEGIIEATVQYALPRGGVCCDEHPFCSGGGGGGVGSLARGMGMGECDGRVVPLRRAYARARARGYGGHVAHLWFHPDRVYLWCVLEDPAGPSLRTGPGARGVRGRAYGILNEGLGVGFERDEEQGELGGSEQTDAVGVNVVDGDGVQETLKDGTQTTQASGAAQSEDEEDAAAAALLGVEGSAATAPDVRIAGEDVDMDRTTPTSPALASPTPREASPARTTTRSIIEYARHTNRFAAFRMDLPPLLPNTACGPGPGSRSTPLATAPLTERLHAYLAPLHADTPAIRALEPYLQPIAALVRFCVVEAAARAPVYPSALGHGHMGDGAGAGRPNGKAKAAGRDGGKKADSPTWRASEVRAVLRAMVGTLEGWRREKGRGKERGREGVKDRERDGETAMGLGLGMGQLTQPTLGTRNAHIVAQVASAIAESVVLAQALLLVPDAAAEEVGGVDGCVNGCAKGVGHEAGEKVGEDDRKENGNGNGHGRRNGPGHGPALGSKSNHATNPGPGPGSRWRHGLTHLMPYMLFSGVAMHCLLGAGAAEGGAGAGVGAGAATVPRGTEWEWEWTAREEERVVVLERAVRRGLGRGVVRGWEGLEVDVDGAGDGAGDEDGSGQGAEGGEGDAPGKDGSVPGDGAEAEGKTPVVSVAVVTNGHRPASGAGASVNAGAGAGRPKDKGKGKGKSQGGDKEAGSKKAVVAGRYAVLGAEMA